LYISFFQCIYEDSNPAGVVAVKIIGSHIISGRLNGSLDFIEIEGFISNRQSPPPFHGCK